MRPIELDATLNETQGVLPKLGEPGRVGSVVDADKNLVCVAILVLGYGLLNPSLNDFTTIWRVEVDPAKPGLPEAVSAL